MSRNKSPYMLETAFRYLHAANFLWERGNLGNVAMVNAAIAIEIILKSFLAIPKRNSLEGTVAEQYEVKGSGFHSLTKLSEMIDRELYKELGFEKYDFWFKEYDNLFVQARYPYEPNSRGGYSDIPIKVGVEIFRVTIGWYKKTDVVTHG